MTGVSPILRQLQVAADADASESPKRRRQFPAVDGVERRPRRLFSAAALPMDCGEGEDDDFKWLSSSSTILPSSGDEQVDSRDFAGVEEDEDDSRTATPDSSHRCSPKTPCRVCSPGPQLASHAGVKRRDVGQLKEPLVVVGASPDTSRKFKSRYGLRTPGEFLRTKDDKRMTSPGGTIYSGYGLEARAGRRSRVAFFAESGGVGTQLRFSPVKKGAVGRKQEYGEDVAVPTVTVKKIITSKMVEDREGQGRYRSQVAVMGKSAKVYVAKVVDEIDDDYLPGGTVREDLQGMKWVWGHKVAWCLGGAQEKENLCAITEDCNWNMSAVETKVKQYLKEHPGQEIILEVKVELMPLITEENSHIATHMYYTATTQDGDVVFSYDFDTLGRKKFKAGSGHYGVIARLTEDSLGRAFGSRDHGAGGGGAGSGDPEAEAAARRVPAALSLR